MTRSDRSISALRNGSDIQVARGVLHAYKITHKKGGGKPLTHLKGLTLIRSDFSTKE